MLLYKTLKVARLAIANKVILNRTNTEVLAANTQKNGTLNVLEFNTIV